MLHHVGHVVRDLDRAIERYRRLGFTVGAPVCPVVDGAYFGVANAHIRFDRNFVELVTVVGDRPPRGIRPLPIDAPPDRLPALTAAVRAAADAIASFLDRFEGVHILIADTPDIDGVAARLTAAMVAHGGVHAIRRPVETGAGIAMEPARYLEISEPGLPPGRVPEGRVGFAENAPPGSPGRAGSAPPGSSGSAGSAPPGSSGRAGNVPAGSPGPAGSAPPGDPWRPEHPNGATRLVECVLCAAGDELPEVTHRYRTYLDGRAGVRVVGASELPRLLPGERPPALPAFVAHVLSVRDIGTTERYLRGNDVPVTRRGPREVFVPAQAALGAAVVFRQVRSGPEPR